MDPEPDPEGSVTFAGYGRIRNYCRIRSQIRYLKVSDAILGINTKNNVNKK
jgi:hypothetical protein